MRTPALRLRSRARAMVAVLVAAMAALLLCTGSVRVAEAAFNGARSPIPSALAGATDVAQPSGSGGFAHPGVRADSALLRAVSSFELVTVSSPHLSLRHKRSIAREVVQPHLLSSHAAQQRLPRRFSKRVGLSFQSERHAVRTMAAGDGAAEIATPKQFDLELRQLDDLFHPSYSEIAQVWRDGVRYREEETVKPLHEVDHCYYGSASPSRSSYSSLHTCHGGFKGFVREGDTVWLLEPAHLHLHDTHIQQHLQSVRDSRRSSRSLHAKTFALNDTAGERQHDDEEEEDLHASHVHVLFRAEDVEREEFMCSVGATNEQKDEFLRTGRMPGGMGTGTHTLHTQSASGEHDHDHDHGHAHSHDHLSSYSTWLAATDPEFSSRMLRRKADQDEEHAEAAHATTEHSGVESLVDGMRPTSTVRHGNTHFTVASAAAPSAPASFAVDDDEDDDDYSVPHNGGLSHSARSHSVSTQATVATLKYVELLVVTDNRMYQLHEGETQNFAAAIVAHIKTTYEATNAFSPPITVVLIGQITWIEEDPYTIATGECAACVENNGVSVDELLKLWNQWRSQSVNTGSYSFHDNGQLFSGYAFEKPTLGYAGVGAMCTPSISGGIESTRDPSEFYNAIIVAHEMGHNFGMNHDSVNNPCAASGFIMNAVLKAPTPTEFSTCSVDYEQNFFASSHIKCLDNVPTHTFGAPICGDGFVQEGEQCDCGDAVSCQKVGSRDPCCNATTCAFVTGATCSAKSGCCDNCQVTPASAKKVCRASANTCDLPETCPGDTAACPEDLGYGTGTACSGAYGPGLCYLNSCLSYLQQCRTSGANFPGAPFDTCVQQSRLNQGQYCSTLWCSAVPGQCTYFRQQGLLVTMADGVPCPDGDGDLVHQCYSGQCVVPHALNARFKWNATGWEPEPCGACDELQSQNVTCVSALTGEAVQSELCSPSSKPASSRYCINEAIGCYGSAASNDDINLFGLLRFSRKMAMFATLGAAAGFLLIMGICYQAVTYQGENEELPTFKGEKGLMKTTSAPAEGVEMTSTGKGTAKVIHVAGVGSTAAGLASPSGGAPGTGTASSKKKRRKKRVAPPAEQPTPEQPTPV